MPACPESTKLRVVRNASTRVVSLVVAWGAAVEAHASALYQATGFCGFWGRLSDFGGRLGGSVASGASPRCGGIQLWDIAFLAVLAVVLVAAIRFRHLTLQRRLELARRMVERGVEPPSELWGASAGGDFRRGVVLLCAGLGILAAAFISGRESAAPAGLVPGFIGLGYLLSHYFASGRSRG